METHSPSEKAYAESQRDAHIGRIAERIDRIEALQALLLEEDQAVVIAALRDGGYSKPGDGFEEKGLEDIRVAIQEGIDTMQAWNDEVAGLARAVKLGTSFLERLVTAEGASSIPEGAAATGEESPAAGGTTGPAAGETVAPAPEKVLTPDQKASLFGTFEIDFASADRSKDIPWATIKNALEAAGDKAIYGLFKMRENGHKVGVARVEKDGRKGFRFDSCSSESPAAIRNIDYFDAEKIAETDWGMQLMAPEIYEELRLAGIIKNRNSWDHLKSPNPGTKEKPGHSVYGFANGVTGDYAAASHGPSGGFRCSLWVPEA